MLQVGPADQGSLMSGSYVSRHNPRRQAVILGRVASPARYDSFYDLGYELVQARSLPSLTVPIGRLLFRWSERDIEQSRQIPPGSSQAREKRYSGVRLTGANGQGALYLASLAGLLRENVHYATGHTPRLVLPGAPDRLREAVKTAAAGHAATGSSFFHAYRAAAPLRLADLRVMTLTRLFASLMTPVGARTRFGFSEQVSIDILVQMVLDPTDYSAARGLSDAIADTASVMGVAGLCATSARGDSDTGVVLDAYGDGVEGTVYALFGAASTRIQALQHLGSYASFKDLAKNVKSMPGFTWIAS